MSLIDDMKIPTHARSSGLDRACTDEEALELYRAYSRSVRLSLPGAEHDREE